jgi:hypothetical protein
MLSRRPLALSAYSPDARACPALAFPPYREGRAFSFRSPRSVLFRSVTSSADPAKETARIGVVTADTGLIPMMEATTMTTETVTIPKDMDAASAAVLLSTMIRQRAPDLPAVVAGAGMAPNGAADKSPAPAATPTAREPGVYFGLPAAEYHADPSLGSTDLKRLLRSPTDYWWQSAMNPDRPADAGDTPDKQKGRALHKLVLEGMAGFEKAFIPEPRIEDFPGALRTTDDLKAVLREKGEKLTGDKAELARRVKGLIAAKAIPEDIIIWDEHMATVKAVAARHGLEILKRDAFEEVCRAATMIGLNPHLANAFVGGVSEVSVFWRDDNCGGIPLKCRFDYLKPFTIPDLKKCANKGEMPFAEACRAAFLGYRYDCQVAHYLEGGYPAFQTLARAGRIFGDCPLPAGFPDRMAAPEDMTFTLVFHQTSGAPVTAGFELRSGAPELAQARADVAAAKQSWRQCLAIYGTDMWVSDAPIRQFALEELPYRYRVAAELAEAA